MSTPQKRTAGYSRPNAGFQTPDGAIVADGASERKVFTTLQAQAALLGWTLTDIGAGVFALGRWGRTRELPGLREVGDLLRRIGGSQ